MKSLVVYFGEPSPIVTEAVHLIFSVVGGLDLTQPTKYHRFGLNIGEDFIGYPVRAPRDVSFAEIHSVAAQLACIFGAAVTAPLDTSDDAMRSAIAATARAIAIRNGQRFSENESTPLELQDLDTDDLLFSLCENIADGNNVSNYVMRS